MPDLDKLKQRLEEAEIAFHKLLTGEREVSVSVSDFGTVTYGQAQTKVLEKYITHLKSQVARLERRPRRQPLWMRF